MTSTFNIPSMDSVLRPLSKFVFFIGLVIHLFLITLFLAPASFLFKIVYAPLPLIQADLLSESIVNHYESVQGQLQLYDSTKSFRQKLVGAILNLRHTYFMDEAKQAAIDLSQLDYGEGVVGLPAAAEYYYQKEVAELSEEEWLTLIQLHAMFR